MSALLRIAGCKIDRPGRRQDLLGRVKEVALQTSISGVAVGSHPGNGMLGMAAQTLTGQLGAERGRDRGAGLVATAARDRRMTRW